MDVSRLTAPVAWRRLRERPEALVVAALAFLALALTTAWKLASEIAEGEVTAFDRAALVWTRERLGDIPGLRPVMLDLTALGDTATLTLVVLAAMGYLLVRRKPRLATFVAAQAIAGTVAGSQLKLWFGRPRPDVVAHWATFGTASFPSGHASNSAIVYLSLALLAAGLVPARAARIYLVAMAAALVCAIGCSRIYLGVHWPTDVLAGWALGSAWALFSAALLHFVQDRTRASQPVAR